MSVWNETLIMLSVRLFLTVFISYINTVSHFSVDFVIVTSLLRTYSISCLESSVS